jgi:type VI protein secretion system component VasF
MKPTAGPWHFHFRSKKANNIGVYTDLGWMVCSLDVPAFAQEETISRRENDARLIAAAPDLLEALQRINEACAQIPEGLEGYLEHLSDAISDARKAIAKATGEQQ